MATNPPVMDTLASLQLPPQVSPLPPSTPVQPDLQSTFASILGKGEQALQNQRGLATQAANVPMAPVGFKPDFSGSFLHSLGQALLAAGASTGPGRDIMQTVQAPAQARRAQQLSAIKTQMEPEQEATGFYSKAAEGAGNLAYKQGILGNKEENTRIAQQRADTAAKIAANRSADMLVKEAQGWKNLDVKTQSNQIRAAFDREITNVARERIAAGQDENSARIQAQEDVKAAASQNQYSVLHPFLSMLGIGPDLSAAPGAGQPKKIEAPTKSGGGGGQSKGAKKGKDPLGIL